MKRTSEEIENICRKLVNGGIDDSALVTNLDEFQKFYTTIVNITKTNPFVSIVNLETMVVAQFSSISPQHFDIIDKNILTENDFDFVAKKQWYGNKKTPIKFPEFIWQEFLLNKGKLFTIFIISSLLLFVINDISFYNLLFSLLIQSSTVFLSLYIIFTVSQSQTLYKDVDLLKNGILQRYYRDDRNVTLLGILTIALTFLGSGLVSLTNKFGPLIETAWIIMTIRVVRAVTIAIVITMLFDTFLTVANYYLYRNRDIIERDMVADILHNDYKENTKE